MQVRLFENSVMKCVLGLVNDRCDQVYEHVPGLEKCTYHEVASGNGGGTWRPSKFSLRTVSKLAWAQSPNSFHRHVLGHWLFEKKQGVRCSRREALCRTRGIKTPWG